uniref:Ring finger protein 122 n=1 Tax=Xiphophorus maculatus TaxID=8083 RepID=A0A3B5PXI4_XIPMA
MHPFQWCNGCFCGLGVVYSNKSCTMPPITFQDLPLNIYMVIFGTGIFVFILSLIFCCYFISKLRHQAQSERFGYREVRQEVKPSSMANPTQHHISRCAFVTSTGGAKRRSKKVKSSWGRFDFCLVLVGNFGMIASSHFVLFVTLAADVRRVSGGL